MEIRPLQSDPMTRSGCPKELGRSLISSLQSRPGVIVTTPTSEPSAFALDSAATSCSRRNGRQGRSPSLQDHSEVWRQEVPPRPHYETAGPLPQSRRSPAPLSCSPNRQTKSHRCLHPDPPHTTLYGTHPILKHLYLYYPN